MRGAQIGGRVRYWAVEDTFLDSEQPEANFGRDALLTAGPGKTILIRFGDLRRALAGKRVQSARLVLTIEIGSEPKLAGVGRMLTSWGEGPGRRGAVRIVRKPKNADPKSPPKAGSGPAWAATWSRRHSGDGGMGWDRAGAAGGGDQEPIAGAAASVSGKELVITGLGPAVQRMLDRWWENYGFALSFSTPADFDSSDSSVGRPRLEVEVAASERQSGPDLEIVDLARKGDEWTATIRNAGDAPAPGIQAIWKYRGRDVATSTVDGLAPGAASTIRAGSPGSREDWPAQRQRLLLAVEPVAGETNTSNNAVSSSPRDVAVAFSVPEASLAALTKAAREAGYSSLEDYAQRLCSLWNETAAPQSVFSFAPEGASVNVRFEGFRSDAPPLPSPASSDHWRAGLRAIEAQLGLPNIQVPNPPAGVARRSADAFPGLAGWGDTRNESSLPSLLGMLYEPWFDPVLAGADLEATDLLSATEVALLNLGPDKRAASEIMPARILLRVMDAAGQPAGPAKLEFFRWGSGALAEQPSLSAATDPKGSVLLQTFAEPSLESVLGPPQSAIPGPVLVRATRNGVTEYAWIKPWELIDSYARGSRAVSFINLRFMFSDGEVDAGTNLAMDKTPTDSKGAYPAQLVAITDGKPETAATLAYSAGDWIELDLGRDRPIGQVDLTFSTDAVWSQFSVMVYATGQRPSEARPFVIVTNGPWLLQNLGSPGPGGRTLTLRGAGQRARFVRIVPATGGPQVGLAEVAVRLLREAAKQP